MNKKKLRAMITALSDERDVTRAKYNGLLEKMDELENLKAAYEVKLDDLDKAIIALKMLEPQMSDKPCELPADEVYFPEESDCKPPHA